MKCLLQMKHAHSITALLLKLFLVGSSQIFCASWAQAQYSSLSEQGAVPEDSLSASPLWQQLLSDLSSSEDFEHVAWQDYEEDLEEMAQHPVNLNTANKDELESVKGIGPTKAQAILDYRSKNGSFKTVDDLKNIKGFGEKTLAKLKPELSVSGNSTIPTTTSNMQSANKASKPALTPAQ